mmetsp:Transcript_58381/g.107773  ORF Transcript_58381/g.107773 Transcript_58381/m.107773 type:complete len:135 (+) Transcript_58381:40-444(+)
MRETLWPVLQVRACLGTGTEAWTLIERSVFNFLCSASTCRLWLTTRLMTYAGYLRYPWMWEKVPTSSRPAMPHHESSSERLEVASSVAPGAEANFGEVPSGGQEAAAALASMLTAANVAILEMQQELAAAQAAA